MVLKKIAPSLWLSGIMVLWGMSSPSCGKIEVANYCVKGIATIGQGLVRTFEGLVAMRVLVGIFEAGLFP